MLFVFATGGVLLPVAHRVDHALAHAQQQKAAHQIAGHIHGDAPLYSAGPPIHLHLNAACSLCNTVVQASADGIHEVFSLENGAMAFSDPVFRARSADASRPNDRGPPRFAC